jgi:hypothetical protein
MLPEAATRGSAAIIYLMRRAWLEVASGQADSPWEES